LLACEYGCICRLHFCRLKSSIIALVDGHWVEKCLNDDQLQPNDKYYGEIKVSQTLHSKCFLLQKENYLALRINNLFSCWMDEYRICKCTLVWFCCKYLHLNLKIISLVKKKIKWPQMEVVLVMRRSIRNFNIPPRAYPGHLTVHRARGGGNLNVVLKGWGIWTGFISCSDVIRPWVFRFLQGLTDLQDRISLCLVNNSFKCVFKRSLKVSLRHISLWKACKVFDWRRNWLGGEVFQY